MKSIRSLSKAYDSVAEAFISSKPAKLSAEIHDAVSIWQEVCPLPCVSGINNDFFGRTQMKVS